MCQRADKLRQADRRCSSTDVADTKEDMVFRRTGKATSTERQANRHLPRTLPTRLPRPFHLPLARSLLHPVRHRPLRLALLPLPLSLPLLPVVLRRRRPCLRLAPCLPRAFLSSLLLRLPTRGPGQRRLLLRLPPLPRLHRPPVLRRPPLLLQLTRRVPPVLRRLVRLPRKRRRPRLVRPPAVSVAP